MTESGRICQRWDMQTPHKHYANPQELGEMFLSDVWNYCRSLESTDPQKLTFNTLQCFTTDPAVRSEDCDVPMCGI